MRGGEGTSRTCGARDVVVLWAGDRGGSIICGVHVMSLKAEAEAENSRVCWEYMMDCRLEEGGGCSKMWAGHDGVCLVVLGGWAGVSRRFPGLGGRVCVLCASWFPVQFLRWCV